MSRARNIKPGFFKNEHLADLPFSTNLLFIGLWTLADRDGRLEDRPRRIKIEIFPCKDVDVDAELEVLFKLGFLTRYENDEGKFIEITAFKKHQNPHYSEKKSVIRPPNSGDVGGNNPIKPESTPEYSGGGSGVIQTLPGVLHPLNVRNPSDSLIPDSLNPDSPNPDSLIPVNQAKSKTKPRPAAAAFALPDWVPAEAWGHYEEMRTKCRAPLTERAAELAIRALYKMRSNGEDVEKVLEQSVLNGWKGVFPVKPNSNSVIDKNREVGERWLRNHGQEPRN